MKIKSIYHRARRSLKVRQAVFGDFAFIHINKCGGTSVEAALGLPKIHDTARQRRDKIGVARLERITSFALVRCPYDKVASHYRYRVKTNQTGLGNGIPNLNEWVRRAYGEREPRYYDIPLMFAPCIDWLKDDDGEVMVDLWVRLEEIDRDWQQIEALIGTSATLSKQNSTVRGSDSKKDKLNAESIAIINDHFRNDFKTFGYSLRHAS